MRGKLGLSVLLSTFVSGCSGEPWEPAPEALPSVVSEPIIGAPAKPVRTIAGLMFDISMGPPNATTAQNVWMGAMNSVRGLYIESSYGMQDIDVELLGPYTLPVANCLTIACCGPSSDRTGNGPEVQRIIDSLPMDYMHYGYLYGAQPAAADCGTWGDAGNPDDPAVYSSYEQSSLLGGAQEIGHNLGMAHEHTMNCGGVTMPDDTGSCSNVEYGSRLSFMGMGRGHPSAYHKVHMGWLSGCNVVTAGGEGTFTLHPLETPCNSTQVIQVAAPKSRTGPSGASGNLTHYYLELRVPIGYDSNAVTSPQVMIYIAGQFSTTRQYARHTFLLDLTPSTSQLSDAGLASVGQSFADPGGGLTFTLDAISMTSASVRITGNGTGMHTCQGGVAFTAPGPADCGMGTGGGGMGGSGGASGSGGAPPGGTAGLGGSAGSAGSGVSGSAGSGVVAGSGPTGGSAGSTATGGTAGTSTGGTATSGSAGAPAAGSSATIPAESELDSGCGCRTTRKRPSGALLTGLVLFALLRRRRARA